MREYDYGYLLDGKPLLLPDADVEMGFSDLDSEDSGRDELGFMHRIVLRRDVATWSFRYRLLTEKEYRYLTALVSGRDYLTLTTPQGEHRVYCAKRSVTLHDRRRGIYKDFILQLIEC